MSTETKTADGTGNTEETAGAPALTPNSVAGQRYVAPAGRHSRQARGRAIARAEALGFTTERELYEHDRAAVLAKLQKGTDGALAQQKNEQNRRSGVGTVKPE